ncbi:UNVERIFIED_CONTAM: hypothetical protein HDU68_012805, partial [Siphonaria sp. JEL0065]
DGMLKACEDGRLGESLANCFEVLELMKLDYANHQLTRIRPHVIERAIEFEKNWFKDEIKWNRSTTIHMEYWLKEAYQALMTPTPPSAATTAATASITSIPKPRPPTLTKLYIHALISLIHHSPHLNEDSEEADTSLLPELFSMDISRLQTFRNDFQDIVILASLMMVYRQLCGAKTTPSGLKTMKENLWVLLNDSDTSLTHIVLEMCRGVGVVRGKEVAEAEQKVVLGVVEKTLVPEGKVFGMLLGRVGEVVRGWCERCVDGSENAVVTRDPTGVVIAEECSSESQSSSSESEAESPVKGRISTLAGRANVNSVNQSGNDSHIGTPVAGSATSTSKRLVILDKMKLAKYGLAELEDEVQDLADRLGSYCKFNHAVYFELLTGFYEESRNSEVV